MEHIGIGFVPGHGPKGAKLAFVGEAPGASEVEQGRPFVGGAGRVLYSLCRQVGLPIEQTYITNAIKCRPPENDIDLVSEEARTWCRMAYLSPELDEVQPNLVVPLGSTALRTLTGGETAVSKRRGSLYKMARYKLIPTIHPAAVMRQQELLPIVAIDLRKAWREAQTDEYTAPIESLITEPTVEQVRTFVRAVDGPFAFDVETTMAELREATLICLSVCPVNTLETREVLCVPLLSQGGTPYWSNAEEEEIYALLTELFATPWPKIAQNGMFDVAVLREVGIEVHNFTFDTMLEHHLVYSDLPHDLGFLASVYTNVPYYKDDVKGAASFLELPDKVLRTYNCRDSLVTALVHREVWKEVEELGVDRLYHGQVVPLTKVLMKMMSRGICVDQKVRHEAVEEYRERVAKGIAAIRDAVGRSSFNPISTKDLRTLFYEELRLPIVKRTIAGKPSTDEEAVEKLNAREPNPLFVALLQLRSDAKVLGTYLENLQVGGDGRVHASFLIHGTGTGRLSCRNPDLQAVPEGIARRIYVPSPGHVFIYADYNQIELRILAELSSDQALRNAFAAGEDIHVRNIVDLFGLSVEEARRNSRARFFAKMYIYRLNYGGSAEAFRAKVGGYLFESGTPLTVEKVQELDDKYRALHPAIWEFRAKIGEQVTTTRKVTNPYGRVRFFLGPIKEILRAAYNFPMQSTAADTLNQSLIAIDKRLDGLLLQVHDSLLLEVLESQVEEAKAVVRECMETPRDLGGIPVVFPATVKVGKNWDELH